MPNQTKSYVVVTNQIQIPETMETDIRVPEQDQSSPTPKQIFILSGQNNMAGRGGVKHHHWDGIVPPDCQPHPPILRLSDKLI
ncbi:hypothetical protein CRYUN_Cryun05aG0224200 [Craigia yunnanensis]